MRQHRFFKDEHGFLLCTSREWMQPPDHGRGDAVGRTVLAAITYGEKDFIDAFQGCCWIDAFGRWHAIRHPEETHRNDFSRDHLLYWVVGLKYINPFNLPTALKVPWRISSKFTQTIDMWLWIRAVARKTWIWTFLYWAVAGTFFRFARMCIRLACRIGEFKTVPYTQFKATPVKELTKNQAIARKIMKIMPSYTVHQTCWALSCLRDSWFKRRLQKLVLGMVEPSNYLCRVLLGDTLNYHEYVDADYYSGLDAYRWSGRLDESGSTDKYPLEGAEQPPYNLDVDILKLVIHNKHLTWIK